MSEATLIISRGKPTKQSSDYLWTDKNTKVSSRASSFFAVDGNYVQDSNVRLCSQTNTEKGFWMVDLLMKYPIDRVVIYNRQDEHVDGLLGVKVELLSVADEVLHECGVINTISSIYTILCNGSVGNKIRLQATTTNPITLCEVEVYKAVYSKTIISINKPTSQSSTLSNWSSNLAVDGIYSQDGSKLSCSHTNNEIGNYWMVDLTDTYRIDYILIYNRQDCCADRIVGVVVELLSKSNAVLFECGRINFTQSIYNVPCFATIGQKVRVRRINKNYIQLCEVEVHGELYKNSIVSTKKSTSQSSTLSTGRSSLAVDGVYLQNVANKSCSRTKKERGYWMVDLGSNYNIDRVVIYNRQDCCANEIVGAIVEVLSKSKKVMFMCGQINYIKSVYTFPCFANNGWIVRIRRTTSNFLTLCEVDVHGVKSDASSIISKGKMTEQSSTFAWTNKPLPNYGLSAYAVDGKYTQDANEGSCSMTNEEKSFWIVDLEMSYNIDYILIYNRQDCCADRLLGVKVELLSKTNKVLHECGMITTVESVYKISCRGKAGQKVRLKATTKTFISVCEVEVHQVTSSKVLASRNQPTTQSSTLSNFHSNLAVDGNYSQNLNDGSCSRTKNELGFWMVDLQKEYRIYRVLIYNRQDCCADQMIGVAVELLSKSNKLLHKCSAITHVRSVYRVLCHSKKGTKIRIRRLTKNFLTLCEVEVYRGQMQSIDYK